MRVTINDSELSAAISAVGGYCKTADTRELACLLLEADEGMKVSATDLNGYATFDAAAMVEEGGRVLVPHRALSAIAKGLPSGPVTLESKDGTCLVTGGRAEFEVPALNPSDFPKPPVLDDAQSVEMPADAFYAMAARVGRAADDPNKGRPLLAGIRVECADGKMTMAAADSYRLCFAEVACDGELSATLQPGFLDHAKAMSGVAVLSTDGRRASLKCDGSEFVQPLVEGTYPKWRALVPKSHEATCTVDAGAIVAAVKRAASVSASLQLKLACDGSALSLDVTPKEGDGARFHEDVPCEGGEFAIHVNPAFLLSMLQSADADTLELGFTNPMKPLMVEGSSVSAVVMPVRAES